jgi:hypothetical protein
MSETQYAVILVQSTSHALRAESILQRMNIACKLIPVPRDLSSDCGMCVRIQETDRKVVLESLEAEKVVIKGVFSA